jgi:BirA family biotin operon repressor/biotin-[acetyl-CoA-carboxylase] ligase
VAVSVLLRPRPVAATWPWLSLLAGLAVVDALDRVCAVATRLKWPNDVLLAGTDPDGTERKVCGVLAEVVHGPDGTVGVVLGTGINVAQAADELPGPQATSLRLAGARTLDRTEIVTAYLSHLSGYYRRWTDADGDASGTGFDVRYRQRCATIGTRVRVHLPGGVLDGIADQVDDQGRLVVRAQDGRVHRLAAGDVVHVRAGDPGRR